MPKKAPTFSSFSLSFSSASFHVRGESEKQFNHQCTKKSYLNIDIYFILSNTQLVWRNKRTSNPREVALNTNKKDTKPYCYVSFKRLYIIPPPVTSAPLRDLNKRRKRDDAYVRVCFTPFLKENDKVIMKRPQERVMLFVAYGRVLPAAFSLPIHQKMLVRHLISPFPD